eukprot:m.39732 g.39732  ORF g.39732 m.39732 type:complete len:96 (+) comp7997_c0_seq1:371-658(+)
MCEWLEKTTCPANEFLQDLALISLHPASVCVSVPEEVRLEAKHLPDVLVFLATLFFPAISCCVSLYHIRLFVVIITIALCYLTVEFFKEPPLFHC